MPTYLPSSPLGVYKPLAWLVFCFPTYFQIASCTRVAVFNIVMFYYDGVGLLTLTSKHMFEASLTEQDGYFSTVFLANYGFQSYFHEIAEFTTCAGLVFKCLNMLIVGRANFHSLLSTYRYPTFNAYFLIIKSDKHMHSLTRFYCNRVTEMITTACALVCFLPLKLC